MRKNQIIINNIKENIKILGSYYYLPQEKVKSILNNLTQDLRFLNRNKCQSISNLMFRSLKNLISVFEARQVSFPLLKKICFLFIDNSINFRWIPKLEKILGEYCFFNKVKAWKYFKLLAQMRARAKLSIEKLENFILENYIISDRGISFSYLCDYNKLIVNKEKFLLTLISQKEYTFDIIIEWFLLTHPELNKYHALL